MMRGRDRMLIGILLVFVGVVNAQRKVFEFAFDSNDRVTNASIAIGVSPIQTKVTSQDVVVNAPALITDGSEKALFFQFNATFNASANNINIALAPKSGNKIKITHIEFSARFGSVNSGNGGIYISKDPLMDSKTELWTCGNNKTFNTYKDFVIIVPDTDVAFSESIQDSIRFVFAHGSNTLGMYINNFVVYGIINAETNPAQTLAINASSITKEVADRPSGANTCWLMDSDIKWPRTVSNESRFAEMKLGALRFPYGHLADNYLWHIPGQYATVATTGPNPKIAAPGSPPTWSWAVNPADGSFVKDMSFDEFIAICKRQQIEPLIVVNAQSHFYNGTTVNYEMLKTSAVEWVRYANVVKGYNVKYWQIGNEVDLKSELYFSIPTYTGLFIDFATAMKAVDPTIKVGTGVLMETAWNEDVLNKAGTLCDFISAHNYQGGSQVAPGGYRKWYKDNFILITNSKTNQNLLASKFSHRPEIDLLITEANITFGDFPDMSIIDLYKALYWFEMNMNMLALKNVKYTYYWGTHSPWSGEKNLGDISCLLENSNANTIRPAGRVMQLINTYLKNRWLDVEREKGYLRNYASVSSDGKEMSVFILNKNLYAEKANLNIQNYDFSGAEVEKITFSGNHFNDKNPVITTESLIGIPTQVELPPISLTVLNYTKTGNTTVRDQKEIVDMIHSDGKKLYISRMQSETMIRILSIDGRVITEKQIACEMNQLDLSHLKSGIYLVHAETEGARHTIKIIRNSY